MAKITRRDLIHGAAAIPAALTMTGKLQAQSPADYPPEITGMRGSHPGSFEVAHDLARNGQRDFGAPVSDKDSYDLVVVGAGVSGLAAAYFYRASKPDARILILDNHDDFGGHAKRNEFVVDGRRLIGYGGSQTMESPSAYSDVATNMLAELAVDLDQFESAYDQDFFVRHGLRGGLFFDKETYGKSAFVDAPVTSTGDFMRLATRSGELKDQLAQMPISSTDQSILLNLLTNDNDSVEDVGLLDLPAYLSSISYLDFLKQRLGVNSATIINLLHTLPTSYFGIGIDGITALEALAFGLPGGRQLGVPGLEWLRGKLGGLAEPYIHHFPDGNASIARLLVRSLIPDMAQTADPAELTQARFDYGLLDLPANQTRIRLSSTVINVTRQAQGARISYVRNGQRYQCSANHCVMACYNMMIPHLMPELPDAQKAALAESVKVPLVYTNVVLRQWHALKELGIGQAFSPNMFHKLMMVDFPVSLAGYQYAKGPDDPLILHMSSAFGAPGLPAKDQFRVGRANLLSTGFDVIEADLRNHLDQMFGPGGFSSDKDIAAITVNRWPHGYAYGGYTLFDPEYAPGAAPHEIGRTTFGPIAIANSDAGARAYLDEAINQAQRAVNELI